LRVVRITRPSRTPRIVAAVAVLAALLLVVSACATSTSGKGSPASGGAVTSAGPSSSGASSSHATTKPAVPTKPVHVRALQDDGEVWGIGFALVLYFSPTPTDSSGFTKAASVTVNGHPAGGAWFWQKPYADQPIQAVYRPQNYWPAHAKISVNLPLKGVSAGTGLSYDDNLTLNFSTGAAHISTVTTNPLQMVVTSDGKVVKTIAVSLGAAATPTYSGTKVVMQKGEDVPGTDTRKPDGIVHMVGPGYSEDVKWSTRITTSGEYIHGAPWNQHIGQISTSNGCTNLQLDTAQWFYNFSLLGDVVIYNIAGQTMPSWDGYGWWNLPWSTWQAGGLLINH
jgi:lipoprotein-anchoring transpeptidase ErfK/SrfK